MSNSKIIKVLTVDDHELIRRGIRFSLLAVEDMDIVGEAQDREEAFQKCHDLQPDVVLMDMRLGGDKDGIEITKEVRRRFPHIQVIILSTFHDAEIVHGAMQAGAIGYLIKGVSGAELTDAIRSAHAGKPILGAEPLADLVQKATRPQPIDFQLTTREQDVLILLVNGKSNPEIAAQLHLSVAAVKYHVGNIFSKLNVHNRTEAATIAIEQNLVPKQE